jgi:hypothetical protein
VPENRADPRSRLIALPVTRIRAHSDRPAEPIFRLEGGPGLTNMKFSKASRFADEHDVGEAKHVEALNIQAVDYQRRGRESFSSTSR